MDKKRYYISVESGVILEDPTVATYEFVVVANDTEIHQLQELFELAHQKEMDTFLRGATPVIPYHDDPENHNYDRALMDIYRMIHRLGTTDTKEHIESMGVW